MNPIVTAFERSPDRGRCAPDAQFGAFKATEVWSRA
jgi:hypothetical protein